MGRRNHSSGTPWEAAVGYSRAVRVGPHVHVSGTTATGEGGEIVGPGDPELQTRRTIENIQRALRAIGAELEHVVRTRIYVTDMKHWECIGRVHGEFFGAVRPATCLVEVTALVSPDMLVEIEADAYVAED